MDLPDSRKRERYNTVNLQSSMLVTVLDICNCPFSIGPYLVAQPAVAKGTKTRYMAITNMTK